MTADISDTNYVHGGMSLFFNSLLIVPAHKKRRGGGAPGIEKGWTADCYYFLGADNKSATSGLRRLSSNEYFGLRAPV